MLSVKDRIIEAGGKILCRQVSFDINAGDCIMLCGANGSGKTTLLRDILDIAENRCSAVMIPARVPKVNGFTTKEFIRLSCYRQSDMNGMLPKELEEEMELVLERFGLSEFSERDISSLSDGEFQKAGIAASIVRHADLILLDEPTAFLDAENRIRTLNLMNEICSDGRKAVIFSTHDLHNGISVCNKVMALGADRIFRYAEKDRSAMEEAVRSIFSF